MLHVCQLEVHFCEPNQDAFPHPLELISPIGEVLNRKKGASVIRLQLQKTMVTGALRKPVFCFKTAHHLKGLQGRVLKLSPSRSDAGTKCPMLVHYSYGRWNKTSAVRGASIKLHSCFHTIYVFPNHYNCITAIQTQV